MFDKLPNDRQVVEVRVENHDWQAATYQDGEFVDAYGMPLDPQKISNWRSPNGSLHSARGSTPRGNTPRGNTH
jgi:hypothetical protein